MLICSITGIVFFPFLSIMLPTTNINTNALIQVTLISVTERRTTAKMNRTRYTIGRSLSLRVQRLVTSLFGLFRQRLTERSRTNRTRLLPRFRHHPICNIDLRQRISQRFERILARRRGRP